MFTYRIVLFNAIFETAGELVEKNRFSAPLKNAKFEGFRPPKGRFRATCTNFRRNDVLFLKKQHVVLVILWDIFSVLSDEKYFSTLGILKTSLGK